MHKIPKSSKMKTSKKLGILLGILALTLTIAGCDISLNLGKGEPRVIGELTPGTELWTAKINDDQVYFPVESDPANRKNYQKKSLNYKSIGTMSNGSEMLQVNIHGDRIYFIKTAKGEIITAANMQPGYKGHKDSIGAISSTMPTNQSATEVTPEEPYGNPPTTEEPATTTTVEPTATPNPSNIPAWN